MGTWGVSVQELVEKLRECLDEIEGDFNYKNLFEALEIMQYYAPTSDSTQGQERAWRRKLKKLDAFGSLDE